VYEVAGKSGVSYVDGQLVKVSRESLFGDVRERMRLAHLEQARCQTFEDLVALGVRRGYGNPHGWARHVWRARRRTFRTAEVPA
jgi:hypothetical protein